MNTVPFIVIAVCLLHTTCALTLPPEEPAVDKHDYQLTNSTDPQIREKRFVMFAIEFLGSFFAEYALNEGIEAIEGYFGKVDPIDKVQETVDEIKESVKELQVEVQKVGSDVLELILGNARNAFAKDINSLNLLMTEELAILAKQNLTIHEEVRQDDIIEQILDDNRGIENALRQLHLAVIGTTTYSKKNILELYWDKMMHSVDQKNYRSNTKTRGQLMNFFKYILDMQALGFTVWFTAVNAKHNDNENTRAYYTSLVKNLEAERLKEQEEHLAETLFKPCGEISLKDYPNRGKALKCSDGFNFGSICTQRCAGSCAEQKHKWDKYYYPSVGFPAVQCLLNGKWSTNHKGSTVVACSFCSSDVYRSTPLPYPQQCYSDGASKRCEATHRTNVGITTDKKCNKPCRAIQKFIKVLGVHHYGYAGGSSKDAVITRWKSWCYVDSKKNWDYCLPDKLTINPDRDDQAITWDGEKCTSKCRPGFRHFYWCYTANDWDYC